MEELLALQRLAGNQAVMSLLGRTPVAQRCGSIDPQVCPCSKHEGSGTNVTVQRADQATAPVACPEVKPQFKVIEVTGKQRSLLEMLLDPLKSGVTAPLPLEVSTETVRDGDKWRLCVTGVTSPIKAESWLATGEGEATLAAATKDNFCTMVGDLKNASGRRKSAQWYVAEATRQHELFHVQEWKSAFSADWAAVRTKIEDLEFPTTFFGFELSKERATKILRGSPAFEAAIDTSHAGGNFPGFWDREHDDAGTEAAEWPILLKRIKEICKRAKDEHWNAGLGSDATGCRPCGDWGGT